jgi:hypothetical protein
MFAAVAGQRSYASQFGNGLVGQGADFRHIRHETGYGAIGYALDGTEDLIELMPERVLGNKLCDGCFQLADLTGDDGQQFVDEGHDSRVGDQAGLIQLCGADLGELAQASDQGAQLLLAG